MSESWLTMELRPRLMYYEDRAALLGAAVLFCFATKLVWSSYTCIRTAVLSRKRHIGVDLKSMGSWAVVTGATDGVGKEYVRQLAAAGLNIVLISRSQEKLNKVAAEIENEMSVRTKCIEVDFTGGLEVYDKISSELSNMEDVAVLVNNIGIANCPDYFCEETDKVCWDMIHLNTVPSAFMTRIILPKMAARRKGCIIFLSSVASLIPMPYGAVYSATKTYNDFLCRAVQAEYRSTGVIFQSFMPGFIESRMSAMKTSLFVPTMSRAVSSSLANLGVQSRSPGCFAHNIVYWIFTTPLLPEWLRIQIGKLSMRYMRGCVLHVRQQQKLE